MQLRETDGAGVLKVGQLLMAGRQYLVGRGHLCLCGTMDGFDDTATGLAVFIVSRKFGEAGEEDEHG